MTKTKKTHPRQRISPPAPEPKQLINLRKLKNLRKSKGMTQAETSKLLGFGIRTYNHYEIGFRRIPLYVFRELCRIWQPDPFTVCELLNLPLDHKLLKKFRLACKKQGISPNQALHYFLLAFTQPHQLSETPKK